MPPPAAPPSPPPTAPTARRVWLAGALLVAATFLAWANAFRVPFLFDDGPAIVDNPAFHDGGSLRAALWPTRVAGETTSGRPLVSLSLALNHALGGERAGGYHLFNLIVHALAGLTLFGIVRRTLMRCSPARERRDLSEAEGIPALTRRAAGIAFAAALLWLLHPLQTESVTYIVQRAEAMVGLCVLLTLYAFIRATETAKPTRWLLLSVLACLAAVGCKEVGVVAPVLVLLYDRAFVSGSWRAAWRHRRFYYTQLAATWLALAALVASTGGRGGTAGFATLLSPWHYLLIQCQAIVHYARLALWPTGLVFDYGVTRPPDPADVFVPGLALLAAFGGALWAIARRPAWGFLALWFFVTLAPSSSFVPVASQTIAEHRMYLALAAPLVALVLLLDRVLSRAALGVALALAVVAGALTFQRNADYASALTLWRDTAAKFPANARAHHNLGLALLDAGKLEEARQAFEAALARKPDADTHFNLGNVLARLNRPDDARRHYAQAIALRPDDARLHNNLGNLALAAGDLPAARRSYETAARLSPASAEARHNLGNVLLETGDAEAALREAEAALRLKPDYAEAHFLAGNACAALGRFAVAQTHYEAALRSKPDDPAAHHNLANVLLERDRSDEALAHLGRALALQPDYFAARRTLALVLLKLGRRAEALPHLEILARQSPRDPEIAAALRAAQR